ncbi:hypothetical protein GF359_03200 [candidate division WOR-3 bacterium]|uniref:DUF4044 domain-containing protein n=1 Tax=candidate division WOR-3 bacterium TaxID=2052148 RepID=A0A9D5K8E9_UNCW3|nr:hypothetical protein [candidate division WOR-3 bacterium]MBD3364202.1 hypothetical protein [candidate division WOR-3 bacterium]
MPEEPERPSVKNRKRRFLSILWFVVLVVGIGLILFLVDLLFSLTK